MNIIDIAKEIEAKENTTTQKNEIIEWKPSKPLKNNIK